MSAPTERTSVISIGIKAEERCAIFGLLAYAFNATAAMRVSAPRGGKSNEKIGAAGEGEGRGGEESTNKARKPSVSGNMYANLYVSTR